MKTVCKNKVLIMLPLVALLSACGGGSGGGAPPTGAENTDGRFVAFESNATKLVGGDLNGVSDVFLHDRATGETTRVSVDSAGIEGNDISITPALSGDGRFVAFSSAATNLAGDGNIFQDIFVRDRQSGTTTRVSVAHDGADTDDGSFDPAISADGRYVAFEGFASNYVDGFTDNNAGGADIFVHDRNTGDNQLVSVAINGNGTQGGDGGSGHASLSADGRYIVFFSGSLDLVVDDKNNATDIFVHDRTTSTTVRVSVASDGTDNNNAKDIFVHDRDADGNGVFDEPDGIETVRVSVASDGTAGNNTSELPAISADGGHVAFQSNADNLVPDKNNSTDIFVHDRETGITERVSVQDDGLGGVMTSTNAGISADGRFVAFASLVETLVDGDDNLLQDIFVRDRASGTTVRVNVASDGTQADGTSDLPAISADGR